MGADGVPAFKPRNSSPAKPAVVISIPKAGTYLVGQYLSQLGLVDLEIHAALWEFSDYRGMTLDEKLTRAREASVLLPIEFVAALVRPGQFIVGHLERNWRTESVLADFARIIVVRKPRDCLASFMRFEAKRLRADPQRNPNARAWLTEPDPMFGFLRDVGPDFFELATGIFWWLDQACVVRFEDLVGDYGREAQLSAFARIAATVGVSPQPEAIPATINARTPTYSGKRTDWETYWTDAAERQYIKLGGEDLERWMASHFTPQNA